MLTPNSLFSLSLCYLRIFNPWWLTFQNCRSTEWASDV